MLFRKSSNLFLSFSLICEVCNVHCKCFLKLFFQVLKIVYYNFKYLRLSLRFSFLCCVVFLCFARLRPVYYVPNVTICLDCPSVFSNVFTVFRLLTDFVCLYTYAFWLSLCKIVRSSVILLLPSFIMSNMKRQTYRKVNNKLCHIELYIIYYTSQQWEVQTHNKLIPYIVDLLEYIGIRGNVQNYLRK